MIDFIDEHRAIYGVEPICRVLPIAPSTYHAHAARRADPGKLSARLQRDAALNVKIRRVDEENFGVCGVRKVWRQLNREGLAVARCTVARLMRRMGLQGVVRVKPVRTTMSNAAVPCPLDRVNRQFTAPRRTFYGYPTSPSRELTGFVYVAFIIDAFATHRRLPHLQHGSRRLRARRAGAAPHERRPIRGGGLAHHSNRAV